jgi:SAM-dependent methyltransferase
VLQPVLTGAPAVLDLGAGCGWLSHRLAQLGCRSVAVDLLADDRDGLGACRHYDATFICVQADFDALPFAPAQFDVVVFNGSLHYAPDVDATLRRAASMLRDGGRLVVIDSPMFESEADGAAMRQRDRDRLRTLHGLESPIQPGEGFLTFARLAASAASTGHRSPKFFATHDGWRRRLMRAAAASGMTDARPARFGVWVAA